MPDQGLVPDGGGDDLKVNISLPVVGIDPGDDFELSIEMLDDSGATLHPIAAVDVAQTEVIAHRRMMDVSTDHSVNPAASGFLG